MIKISKLADYAIHIVHALMSETTCASAAKIAKKTLIPEPTVSKILKKLAESDLLVSSQGPKGGYQLAKNAEKISLAELITAIDGKPAMTECCKTAYDCARDAICGQQSNWQKINKKILAVLEAMPVSEMKNKPSL
ncbi:MAG: SUF system Fe-S cluster assembly regulator [Gammaproteobacteria bacterium CG_4_10_14_0_8_um_filter_38_16]|nr:MAG: SUF system Fe-S cluster assembly regulator [Gammaproteobacteria bacterium CG_4_10_14_0_8_um_filter_38_16]PJA02619.1 MAG: SUF system Fe-S cluster assembly regulator [Gammaproteobacteria bacterium CG_4_10_14_0_2_um_filter_38_22]PJB11075.1 MAG: SUF system Fe-S cluster assembly regulator [Gammaproteobacteria bacterium CG_4_9_14_3_um_filter_38_9]